MPMLTVGVDLAAQYRDTAVAYVEWFEGTAAVRDLVCPADDEAVILAVTRADKAGIDCPLGWPDAFVAFVDAHRAGRLQPPQDESGGSWRRRLVYRVTDEVVRDETNLVPLSVAADRIAHPAMRCAALMAQLAQEGRPVERTGDGVVVEVYPAASLKKWELTHRGYKRAPNVATLGGVVNALLDAAPWLSLGEHEDTCRRSDHALDAVIAALTARAAWLGLTTRPAEHQARNAQTEGWIAIPVAPIEYLARETS